MFRIIHEIVFYGRGGYSWGEVYNFPIWLRRATHQFISEYINKENEAQKGNSNTTTNSNTDLDWAQPDKSKLNKPSKSSNAPKVNLPSYVSKASKK